MDMTNRRRAPWHALLGRSSDVEHTPGSAGGQQMPHNVSKSQVVDKLVSGCKQTLVHVIHEMQDNNDTAKQRKSKITYTRQESLVSW